MAYRGWKCVLCGDVFKISTHECLSLDEPLVIFGLTNHLKQKHKATFEKMKQAYRNYHRELAKIDKLYQERNLSFWFKLEERGEGTQQSSESKSLKVKKQVLNRKTP